MAFATAGFGAATGPITATLIVSAVGEVGASYDASGNLVFTRATASTWTPSRFDTIIMDSGADPLGPLLTGPFAVAGADCGMFVSASAGGVVYAASTQGLPANFGPGRGKWTQAEVARLRVTCRPRVTVGAIATGVGASFSVNVALVVADVQISIRNHIEEKLDLMSIRIECRHSMSC